MGVTSGLVSVLVLTSLFSLQFDVSNGQAISFTSSRVTSSDTGCNCVLLRKCFSLFTPGKSLTLKQASEIRHRSCGFQGNNLMVCCPISAAPTMAAPATPPPPPPTYPTTLPLRCGQPVFIQRGILGGTQALLGAHPWMVALGYRGPKVGVGRSRLVYKCGGSLITTHHVITAAHCVHPNDTGSDALEQLNVGDWNTQTDPDCIQNAFGNNECAPLVQTRTAAKITWHPQYNSNRRYNNDIAVIRLNEEVDMNAYVQPICIPDSFINNGAGYFNLVATGWGTTEVSHFADVLQEVSLPFVEFSTCNNSFNGILSEHQLCAGKEDRKYTCLGISGGPLIAGGQAGSPFQLVGVTSFREGFCSKSNDFGVYTVVADFRNWIQKTLRL